MANIRKRTRKNGSVSYLVQVRLKGHPPEAATFDRREDARRWATQVEADIRAGRRLSGREARNYTLTELIDRYKDEVLPRKGKSSRRNQAQQLDWYRKRIGAYPLTDVTTAMLVQCRTVLQKTPTRAGKKRSDATINRYEAALRHAFTVAMNAWEWVDDTPFRKLPPLKESRGRVRFLSDEERKGLLEACETRNPALYPVVVLAVYTEMRKEEIMGLRWKDVDLERRRIILEETKNGERRQAPLASDAYEVLVAWRDKRRSVKPGSFVFPSRHKPSQPIDLRRPWRTAIAEAGLKDFHFHDTRHTCASYLAMSGATPMEIAEFLGHKSLQMVKRYSHLAEGHLDSVAERMAAKFGSEGAGKSEGEGVGRSEKLNVK